MLKTKEYTYLLGRITGFDWFYESSPSRTFEGRKAKSIISRADEHAIVIVEFEKDDLCIFDISNEVPCWSVSNLNEITFNPRILKALQAPELDNGSLDINPDLSDIRPI